MFARWLTLMCFICLFVGCSKNLEQTANDLTKPQLLHPKTEVRAVPDFTQIYIQGPFHVHLHTNRHQKASLKIDADTIDLQHIRSYVKQGVLYISDGPEKAHIGKRRLRMGEATLEINVPELHGFTYKGEGIVTGHRIHSSLLDIWIDNPKKTRFDGWMNLRCLTVLGHSDVKITGIHSRDLRIKMVDAPKVELKGEANLRRLDMEGRGSLRLVWVKSTDLIIRLKGSVQVTLAGAVNRLDGVFSDHTRFNGRYLRVKEAFVKTNGDAVSDIAVVENQHALARDRSDIYYYNLPVLKTDFMARNGAILDMRPDELKEIQPYTIYNH